VRIQSKLQRWQLILCHRQSKRDSRHQQREHGQGRNAHSSLAGFEWIPVAKEAETGRRKQGLPDPDPQVAGKRLR
jgi:hypothetical protein